VRGLASEKMKTSNRSVQFYVISVVLAALASMCALRAQTVWRSFDYPSAAAYPLRMDRGSAGLWQTLLKLRTRASLLMLVAHPDDEDGGLLAYESRGQGARVILLTLNRGEGGQNVMSSAYWDALGVLRTEELLAADRYYGVQQYFARLVDFGFSKTLAESMQKWGHERVLYDAVRAVRLTRPLVITSVWVGGPSDGHGQHEVSGEIAQEVFKAAADPHIFPDQIQAGLQPWQALKVYERVPSISIKKKGMYDYASRRWYPVGVYDYIHHRFLPGKPAANVSIPEGRYSPLLGSSFVQIGAEGLNQQKSQNGGVGRPPLGAHMARYHRYVSLPPASAKESSFFGGIDTSLMGIAEMAPGSNAAFLKEGLAHIDQQVEAAIDHFSAGDPERTAPMLAKGMEETRGLLDQVRSSQLRPAVKYNVEFELRVKQNQFNTALIQALGLAVRATVVPPPKPHPARPAFEFRPPATFQVATPGQTFWVNVRLTNPTKLAVTINRVSLAGLRGEHWTILPQKAPAGVLAGNKPATALYRVVVPQNAAYTQPYYSRPDIEQPYYDILDKRDLNLPFAPYPLSAWADLSFQGARIRMGQVVQTVKRERGPGDVLAPLVVGPAISVWVSPRAGIIPLERSATSLRLMLRNNTQGRAKGSVKLEVPAGWTSSPPDAPFDIEKAGENQAVSFRILAGNLQQRQYRITAVAHYNGRDYREGFETVGYPGLRPYNFYRAATYRVTGADIKTPKDLNVGYVAGTGDRVPESLESLGIAVHFLTSDDLAAANLHSYDAIILGVRAYAAREDVKTYNRRLLDYVQNGGVLVVQYNTPEYDHNFGPYPYSLTQNPEVVVDENSRVNILIPSNPLLSWPNKITDQDFAGWFEERGHSFMKSWDSRYQALLETHDPDQPPQKGGLLYAGYGKGIYIYDAYALYRQLPEGVPGAYRLMVNMVSLDRNPLRGKRQVVVRR
jgi:LmbE family N-acetylglucosaminyl deacetylase